MADIFISYASVDRPFARRLADALEACGWSVWWDHRNLRGGEHFDRITACCTEEEEAKEPPFPAVDQATRTEFGRSSIRLSTGAMATSVARASSLWKRSPSPMTCFQRANWPSTPAL